MNTQNPKSKHSLKPQDWGFLPSWRLEVSWENGEAGFTSILCKDLLHAGQHNKNITTANELLKRCSVWQARSKLPSLTSGVRHLSVLQHFMPLHPAPSDQTTPAALQCSNPTAFLQSCLQQHMRRDAWTSQLITLNRPTMPSANSNLIRSNLCTRTIRVCYGGLSHAMLQPMACPRSLHHAAVHEFSAHGNGNPHITAPCDHDASSIRCAGGLGSLASAKSFADSGDLGCWK